MCSGDASLCQITLTTCFSFSFHLFESGNSGPWINNMCRVENAGVEIWLWSGWFSVFQQTSKHGSVNEEERKRWANFCRENSGKQSGDCTNYYCETLCERSDLIYTMSQKSSHLLTVLNFVHKIFALLESAWNLLQNPYDITHSTLGMLLHYLGKVKIQIYCGYRRKHKQIAF